MEFTKFFKLLKKHKYGLFAIPILVMAITFFLVRTLPNVYLSTSRLSAGLTAGSQASLAQQILSNAGDATETKINQTFSNVTQTMQLKIVYDQVSYKLILHDLTSEKPFRKYSQLLDDVTQNPEAKKHAIEVYTKMYTARQPLLTTDPDQNGLYEVLKSMKYDYEALRDKIRVYRVESSDFIDVAYESEDPSLSAFTVNTLCTEFITYYSMLSQQNKRKANDFLYDMMIQKKDSLNAKIEALKNFKLKKGVLDITSEAGKLYTQIADFETRLSLEEKEIEAKTGAINAINTRFNQQEQQYIESNMVLNQDIVATQEQLNRLNDQYIKSNFDETLKARIDALKKTLEQKTNQLTDKYMVSTLVTKENLIAQKLRLETELALSRNSIQSYKNALANLNARISRLAPNQATIQSYEADIQVTTKEYLELLNRYNQGEMQISSSSTIKQIEEASPGLKQPSKKLILVILSGMVSFVMYLLILFILYYLDDSIKEPNDLVDKTDTKVLGALPTIKSSFMDLQKLWNIDNAIPGGAVSADTVKLIGEGPKEIKRVPLKNVVTTSNSEFKKLIRATRFEINMALMGGRNLVITSLKGEEGKTLVTLSLVSAFQMMNKKVLLIDGNFINPGITTMTQPKHYIEDYLTGALTLEQMTDPGNITVLGNYGSDISLFEINSESEIEQKMLELKDVFDIVLIESSALNTMNQSKEWIVVSDRVLCVYEANMSIKNGMKDNILYLKSMESKFIGWVLNKVTK